MNKSEMQDRILSQLVNNALDFLEVSITELQEKPKYSVIHFHAAVELFLKARLLDEHWTLVVAPRKELDWQNFLSGEFVSVSMEDAITRLAKVIQSGLSDNQIKTFRKITKHRNQTVHFFHEPESEEAGRGRIQSIVKEQLLAWYYLHELLLKQWGSVFNKWKKNISRIDKKLRVHHDFLQIIFEDLKPTIADYKSKGFLFLECPSCGFEADKHKEMIDEPYDSECLVCGLSELCIKTSCDECDDGEGTILFRDASNAECSNCRESYGGEKIREIFVDKGKSYLAFTDGNHYPFPISCGECGSYKTVVEISEGRYLCTECFSLSEEYDTCEWCNEESTDLSEGSYLNGCPCCEGRAGWDDD